MTLHVIVGKGPIGSTTAELLLARDEQVRVLSKSGAPGDASAAEYRAVDASDAAALTQATAGATVIYNCVNPAYHRWASDWPPVSEALMTAAEAHGAVLVTASNLYGYGPGSGVMTEKTPLASTETKGLVRAEMWRAAKARHDAGRIRATEVRASDYIGPRALETAHVGSRLLEPLLAGKTVRPIGSADQPHSWTYLPDLAAALIAAGKTEAAWGSAWHAPTPEAKTFREVAQAFADAAGLGTVRISPLPMWVAGAVGVVVPMIREIHRIGYQSVAPFVMDSTATEEALGLRPTDWDTIIRTTLAWWAQKQGR